MILLLRGWFFCVLVLSAPVYGAHQDLVPTNGWKIPLACCLAGASAGGYAAYSIMSRRFQRQSLALRAEQGRSESYRKEALECLDDTQTLVDVLINPMGTFVGEVNAILVPMLAQDNTLDNVRRVVESTETLRRTIQETVRRYQGLETPLQSSDVGEEQERTDVYLQDKPFFSEDFTKNIRRILTSSDMDEAQKLFACNRVSRVYFQFLIDIQKRDDDASALEVVEDDQGS